MIEKPNVSMLVSQKPIQSQPVTLAPATQSDTIPAQADIPAPAPEVSVPDPDFDGNDPVMYHATTAKGPSKKRVFDNKDQRDEVLQPYLDEFVNSPEHQGTTFNAGKHSNPTSNKLPLKSQHPHKRPFNSKKRPKLSLTIPKTATLRKKGTFGSPDLNHQFSEAPHLDHCVLHLFKNDWLTPEDKANLFEYEPLYKVLDDTVQECKNVDFSSLAHYRTDWSQQKTIPEERCKLFTACLIHFNGHVGDVIRYVGGNYTAEYRDVEKALAAVKPLLPKEDYLDLKRCYEVGSPNKLVAEVSRDNSMLYLQKGNHPNMAQNPEIVQETMNKEEKNCHVLPLPAWLMRFLPGAHHVPQALVLKPGKDPRLVWDGTKKHLWNSTPMNDLTSAEDEPPITFGKVKFAHLIRIWNLRITYTDEDILLCETDFKACFRNPKMHPDTAGAFGFIIDQLMYIPTGMVFGSNTSGPSWEPFRRAASMLALHYYHDTSLVGKHKDLLDVLLWEDDPAPQTEFVQAVKDDLNPGVLDDDGKPVPTPHNIYVDDNLLAEVKKFMPQAIAAAIEAIFVLLGSPDLEVREMALSYKKFQGMLVSHQRTQLGMAIDTRKMTVSVPLSYLDQVRLLLRSHWHIHRKRFTVNEAAVLCGKIGHMAEVVPAIYHLLTHMFTSIAAALNKNKKYLALTSKTFREAMKEAARSIESENDLKQVSFARGKVAKGQHRSKLQHNILPTLREELTLLHDILDDPTVTWSCPIAHLVPRQPDAEAAGDSSLRAAGGWSTDLGFWWHLEWPDEVVKRTKLFLPDNKSGKFISINLLEYATVIINYAASLVAYTSGHTNINPDTVPFPVLLNWADNKASIKWTNVMCTANQAGRSLGRLFCALLLDNPLGINCDYIRTTDNTIADDISRLKKSNDGIYNYSSLLQDFPQLQDCKIFQPSKELLSIVVQSLLNGTSPPLHAVRSMKPSHLGRLL